MATKVEKKALTFEQAADFVKAAKAIVFLMVGQLAVGLIVLILFVVSFVSSPLRPLLWAQVAAVAVLIIGGAAIVAVVVVKYRKEIVHLFSRK